MSSEVNAKQQHELELQQHRANLEEIEAQRQEVIQLLRRVEVQQKEFEQYPNMDQELLKEFEVKRQHLEQMLRNTEALQKEYEQVFQKQLQEIQQADMTLQQGGKRKSRKNMKKCKSKKIQHKNKCKTTHR